MQGMKRSKTHLVRVCLFLLAAVPAYCQRGSFGIDVGQTADKFDSLSSVSGLTVGIDGQLTVLRSNTKTGRPSVVGGGEIRLPSDSGNHAREYAVFGGLRFQDHDLSIGFNVQVHKIVLPTAFVDNQYFNRYTLELLEIPLVLKYNFLSSKRAFIEVQGAPEFSPKFKRSSSLIVLSQPNFDHGYFVRGSVGYNFGKWYAKANYETRYFKFNADPENPNNLYNWKSNLMGGGVGFNF
jgi:hypothetical protein